MNITLFGGSFNPPHIAHLIVMQQALELIPDNDEVWLLPAYKHTFQKELADFPHRLKMCKTLLMQFDQYTQRKVRMETIECDQKLSGETYETITLLKEKHPDNNFSFLMGSDQLPHFNKWGNYDQLLKLIHFYIYPRAGHSHPIEYDNMTILHSESQVITNISSTIVRDRISASLPINHLVPQALVDYISVEQLYK